MLVRSLNLTFMNNNKTKTTIRQAMEMKPRHVGRLYTIFLLGLLKCIKRRWKEICVLLSRACVHFCVCAYAHVTFVCVCVCVFFVFLGGIQIKERGRRSRRLIIFLFIRFRLTEQWRRREIRRRRRDLASWKSCDKKLPDETRTRMQWSDHQC